MSRVLVTFPGKFGDILWALPTVRAISQMVGESVDFAVMPTYNSLLPLLQLQPYIDQAFVIDSWLCTGSPYGDQPWQPPKDVEAEWERSFHLGYRGHPGIHCRALPLIDFTADQQNIRLVNPIPFIDVPSSHFLTGDEKIEAHVAYAFSAGAPEAKAKFLDTLITQAGERFAWVNVAEQDWVSAAALIKTAICFIGSRSSNNVIAHGVGQKNIFIYEPEMSRHAQGPFGMVFGCPYDEERTHDPAATVEQAAVLAVGSIFEWLEQSKVQEIKQ